MDEKLKTQIIKSHEAARPVVWYGTGLSVFKNGEPAPSKGYGLGSLSMLFKAAAQGSKVQHIVGDCENGYGIPREARDRLVADRLRIDEMIAKRLQSLKTVDGRTIDLRTMVASRLEQEPEAEPIRRLVYEILSKYDGVPNFEKRKLYVAKQTQWETQTYMAGGAVKVGWELPSKVEECRATPVHELIEKEHWNEVLFFRILDEVLREIDPNNDVRLVTVSGEPDMATGMYKPPYSSVDTHVSPLIEEPFDQFVEKHGDIKAKKRSKFLNYYDNEVVGNFESVFGELPEKTTPEKVRAIQDIVLGGSIG